MTTKNDLRAAARTKRTQLAVVSPDFASLIVVFSNNLALERGCAVASYWPFRDEADPRQLAAALEGVGHALLLPCIASPSDPLTFRLWHEGDATRSNAFGISEPLATSPKIVPRAILVPLLAFDAEGYRLGYGGGYYDRTLAELRARGRIVVIGVAYAGQECESLPRESHDQKLDMVITEKGVRIFAR